MKKITLKPFNVIDKSQLPGITVDREPVSGDPIEIEKEMYFVCEAHRQENNGIQEIGVIPLVVKNPKDVANISSYIDCLSIAHRRVKFRKDNNICDFNDCDEMTIS